MTEFSFRIAHHTPTSFSDDVNTPFEDLGLSELPPQEILTMFAGKKVLDIGSGFEGFARGLFSRFGQSDQTPTVVNLNPQFTDWRMRDEYIDGKLRSYKLYKQDTIKAAITELMEMAGEDYAGYFAQRTALAGLVQALPFADNSFDIIISTWGFPKCLYDSDSRPGRPQDHQASYSEIWRTLKPGGKALLAPVTGWEQAHAFEQLQLTDIPEAAYSITDAEGLGRRSVLVLQKPD